MSEGDNSMGDAPALDKAAAHALPPQDSAYAANGNHSGAARKAF